MSHLDPFPGPDDPFNPYETPRASLGRPDWAPGKFDGTTLPFEVGAIFARTWEIFKAQWGLAIGVFLGCFFLHFLALNLPVLVSGVVGGIGGAVAAGPGAGAGGGPPAINAAAQTQIVLTSLALLSLLGLAAFVFVLWISMGQTLVFLRLAQGRNTSFGDVFRGGRYIVRFVLASIVLSFALMVGLTVGVIPGAVAAASGAVQDRSAQVGVVLIGVLVAYGAAIWLMLRFSQYYFLIIDRDAGVIDSLRMSTEITRGRLMGFAGLGLLAALVNLGGTLACGVGMVATVPFTLLLFAVSYQSMSGGPVADPYGYGKPAGAGDLLLE